MGNNYSSTSYIKDVDSKKQLDSDIGQKNLKTNFSSAFMAVTILMIIFAAAILAGCIYLSVNLWVTHPDKNDEQDQKIISYAISVGLVVVMLVLGLYYLWYIEPDIRLSDILVTDETRVTTSPLSDLSFKHNMTNLIAHKLGKNDNETKSNLFQNLDRKYVVDPTNYFRSQIGRDRVGGSEAGLNNFIDSFRRGGYTVEDTRNRRYNPGDRINPGDRTNPFVQS